MSDPTRHDTRDGLSRVEAPPTRPVRLAEAAPPLRAAHPATWLRWLLPRLGVATPRRHLEMLLLALLAMVAMFCLEIRPGERVQVRGHPSLCLPPLCAVRQWLDAPCPGCGLTRSFICLSRGDWGGAWRYHRLGWLIALLAALQIPYRLGCLLYPARVACSQRLGGAIGLTLVGLLVANWLWLVVAHAVQ